MLLSCVGQCCGASPVLQEGCLLPPRPPSSQDRSRTSSSTTRPRDPQCRTPPACTRRPRSSPAGWPRPASLRHPCRRHCSSHSRRSRQSHRQRHHHPMRPSQHPPLASILHPRSLHHRPCMCPCPGRRRCRPHRCRASPRYSAPLCSVPWSWGEGAATCVTRWRGAALSGLLSHSSSRTVASSGPVIVVVVQLPENSAVCCCRQNRAMQRACVHCPTILPSKADVRGRAQMRLRVAGHAAASSCPPGYPQGSLPP